MSLREDIESRIQILDVVNRYVSTKKAGVNYKGLCPFHSEKTPSFVISPSKNIAHCFSCGKGGGPIKFLMEIEKIGFREAASILAKDAGIEMKTEFFKDNKDKSEDIYSLYREATNWYHEALFLDENRKALDYLLDRKISIDTIKKFQLGYSHAPRDLLFFLREKGFLPQFIIDSGLFVSETRDKFFGRIIFPIANSMGHTVAFTGRVLDDGMPKYLNSPVSHIFDKSSILYGLHLAKQAIAKSEEVNVVEGQMDTIKAHQKGEENTVGVSGTALTKEHIRTIKRFAKRVYLNFDTDNAGIKATFSSIDNLLNEDLEIRIISDFGNGAKDLDEFLTKGGNYQDIKKERSTEEKDKKMLYSNELKEMSLSVIEFYLHFGDREFDINSIIGKKKWAETCLKLIIKIQSSIEVDIYLEQISRKLGIDREILYSEYYRMKKSNKYDSKGFPSKKQYQDQEEKESEYAPSLPNLIAGYIYRYQFLDLFFREFQYTEADLTDIPDSVLLQKLVYGAIDPDDEELLRILDLHLEEEHTDANPELIERAFRDLLRAMHKILLESEKIKKLSHISPENPEYLHILSDILAKEKKIGLRR